ncbi:MAG: type II toxin-antitoxin system RelE/ParE family toxin [Proteobacteria bacterium]|nr:type II toxin-antitoxin system RelE/ParE family toxin [Pseudomonadota bacterium]
MRKIVYHRLAKQDLIAIRHYTFVKWGKIQSIKYLRALRQAIQLIKKNPLLGLKKEDIQEGAYSFIFKSHIIYYQFDINKIVVIAVFHQSMLPTKHLQGRML